MRLRVLALAVAMAALVAMPSVASADGTEALGTPSISIASGTGVASGGTGLIVQPGTITVDVPAGATVKQVLAYWEGHFKNVQPQGDNTLRFNGTEVTGTSIGGPTNFYGTDPVKSESFRADVTSLGLIAPGLNSVVVDGMDNNAYNNGASLVAIYELPGQSSDIQARDGNDLAFYAFDAPLDTTVPQTYNFAATAADRTADLTLLAGSVEMNRPNSVVVTSGGVTTETFDVFTSSGGADWDNVKLPVTVPAGATSLTVQILSKSDGSSNLPASLSWVGSYLSLPKGDVPPPPNDGCTLTIGYWKTHADPATKKFDATWDELALGANTPLFGTGKTWLQAFNTQPRGNAYWILAHQYMGAVLNQLAGADTGDVDATLAQAKSLLETYDGNPQPMSAITGSVRTSFVEAANILDGYNNGLIGPGHCTD